MIEANVSTEQVAGVCYVFGVTVEARNVKLAAASEHAAHQLARFVSELAHAEVLRVVEETRHNG